MHNFSPTSPVLGDPLQLFPAQPRLRDICVKVTSPGVFLSPPLSLALRVPRQGLTLSQFGGCQLILISWFFGEGNLPVCSLCTASVGRSVCELFLDPAQHCMLWTVFL